jgi:hypothetical protein
MRAGETSDFKPSKLLFSIFVIAEKNNVGQSFLNNLRTFNKQLANQMLHPNT